jgi:hypothetical protein
MRRSAFNRAILVPLLWKFNNPALAAIAATKGAATAFDI